ncbi:MAG TPA: hypothetical protein VF406_13435 [Thermodesulfobacteriota bacterium]
MINRTNLVARTLAATLAATMMASPITAWSAPASLGTARGVRAAEISIDSGARWLALTGRSLPVLDGARIRSTSGAAMLELADGSRVNVLPYSAVRVREAADGLEIALEYGRLTFRLPEATRVVITTEAAALEPVRGEPMAGEVFAAEETTGLKMSRGRLAVRPTAAAEPVRLASLEPVFLPKPPAASGAVFTTDLDEAAAPAGSRSVFAASGENLGYVRPDGQFVVHPGYANDLTGPFAPRTVALAMASVPEVHRATAEPLFDVNGAFVGYTSGPVFYAQATGTPTPAVSTSGAAAAGAGAAPPLIAGAVIAGTAGLAVIAGAANDSDPSGCRSAATPVSPCP